MYEPEVLESQYRKFTRRIGAFLEVVVFYLRVQSKSRSQRSSMRSFPNK